MPTLAQSLQGRDLGHLRIIADLWKIDFHAPDTKTGLTRIAPLLINPQTIFDTINSLPESAQQAIDDLLSNGGKLSWTIFTRRYGAIREMGSARRDRELPYQDSNARMSETLWYRGLVARAFFDTQEGPQEFAFIPDEFLNLLAHDAIYSHDEPPTRPATSSERRYIVLANDYLVDDICTALAGFRLGYSFDEIDGFLISPRNFPYRLTAKIIFDFSDALGLLEPSKVLKPDPVRHFLEIKSENSLLELTRSWVKSQEINELKMLPGVIAEGEWKNDPLTTRQFILDSLSSLMESEKKESHGTVNPFWSLSSFIAWIKRTNPDFQRTAGEYESWFFKDSQSDQNLRGFENWDRIEGELIRFILSGPLHWLGILDLAYHALPDDGNLVQPTAFRFSTRADNLLNFTAQQESGLENRPIQVNMDGEIYVPRSFDRSVRYQIARFSNWDGFSLDTYRYHITPQSLSRAREQGLKVQHILHILAKSARNIPPTLISALQRWESRSIEARFERVTILRLKNPDDLRLLKESKAKRFLGEQLGPVTIIVQDGAWKKVASSLIEMGILVDDVQDQ